MNRFYLIIIMVFVGVSAFCSQHANVVWNTPSRNSSESMPCGGGDIGMNIWVEEGDLLFYVSRSGTFDENNCQLKQGRFRIRLSPNPLKDAKDFRQELKLKDGYVEVSAGGTRIQLWADIFHPVVHVAPNESVFIVYPIEKANESKGKEDILQKVQKSKNSPAKELLDISLDAEEYTVTFVANGQTVTRKALFDWSKEDNERIRYYSGTAIYKTTFPWKYKEQKDRQVYLHLGTVYNLATVRVNGIDCGTVWTAPYRADITAALKKGTNELEIEVTNTWANALKGTDEGKAPFEGIWTNAKYRKQENTLLPGGLLGPLYLEQSN